MLLIFFLVFSTALSQTLGPISKDFQRFLSNQPRRNDNVLQQIRSYDATGSFGGRSIQNRHLKNIPIIFIHGNSDSALKYGSGEFQSGWNDVITYFLAKGYSLAELYGITYGDRNISNSFTRYLNCADLLTHRRFIESVLQYTGSSKVNIIAHSMGVTIARRVIKGGKHTSKTDSCDLGWDISKQINTLISIASANYGMCACENAISFPACGVETGFYPGSCSYDKCSSSETSETCLNTPYSKFLMDLNGMSWKEANFIASFWSQNDEILGEGTLVWGKPTSLVPGTDYIKIFSGLSHNAVKTQSVAEQFEVIRKNENSGRGFVSFDDDYFMI